MLERPVDDGATPEFAMTGCYDEGATGLFIRAGDLAAGRNRLTPVRAAARRYVPDR